MFVHPRLKTVAVFTPPALPGFFAIPTTIPNQTLFCRTPFHGCGVILGSLSASSQELSGRLVCSCSLCAARCCLRPRGGRLALVAGVPASVACGLHKSFGPPKSLYNGANYQIQRLT